jgi:replicative DNA helicase
MNPETSADSPARKPPQALEAEAAVLGAMLLNPDTVPIVLQYLSPDDFYLATHRKVYQAIRTLFDHTSPTDIVTVTSELKRMKELEAVGGQPFLSGLLEGVLTTAHCEEHAQLVLEKSVQRQLILTATEIVQAGYDEARRANELVEEAEQKIFKIREAGSRRNFQEIKDLLKIEMERVEKAMAEKKMITGVETGFVELDEKTSGFQPGDLIIIAGRPGMGKTAFALSIAAKANARRPVPIAIFSLEMSAEALTQRMMCAEAGLGMHALRRGMISARQRARLAASLGNLYEAPIQIDDTPGLTALDMRARARRLRSQGPLGMVIIDYLQLMESAVKRREANRQQEITEITRALKAMAKELNTPVVVLSQLSRATEKREDRRPQLADLRESGSIEQDADVVLFLFRPVMYKKGEVVDPNLDREAVLDIAKQRNGPTGEIQLTFLSDCMRFENREGRSALPEPPPPTEDEEPYDDIPE